METFKKNRGHNNNIRLAFVKMWDTGEQNMFVGDHQSKFINK